MTYELAKKLKDAGFPQKGFWFYGSNETDIPCLTYQANPFDTCSITFKKTKSDDEVVMLPYFEKVVLCYAPTLSELISALGQRRGLWIAEEFDDKEVNYRVEIRYPQLEFVRDSDLETALAKLWLIIR